jgi:HopA1 effector protein family
MPLFDSELPDLLETLEDIASNINIQSDFKITHPNYQPLELAEAEANSLKQLPSKIQDKYLNLQLRTFIHGIYFDGSLKSTLTNKIDNNVEIATLENNTVRGINRNYYTALESNNCGEGFYEPGWLVIRQEEDGLLVVQKNDLTLHVEQYGSLQPSQRNAQINDTVAILMPKDRLELGYYIAIGNAGFVNMQLSKENPANTNLSINIYFNFTPQAAANIMQALTQQLNAIDIPFSFKVAYDLDECLHHYDSGILNIESDRYSQIVPILQRIYCDTPKVSLSPLDTLRDRAADFRPEVPLFTKHLAPGLGLAEVPAEETFGINRCRIIANALLDAYRDENNTLPTRISYIKQHFEKMNISLQNPYLNPDSQDIYQFQ